MHHLFLAHLLRVRPASSRSKLSRPVRQGNLPESGHRRREREKEPTGERKKLSDIKKLNHDYDNVNKRTTSERQKGNEFVSIFAFCFFLPLSRSRYFPLNMNSSALMYSIYNRTEQSTENKLRKAIITLSWNDKSLIFNLGDETIRHDMGDEQ